jgi:hypothetical protein
VAGNAGSLTAGAAATTDARRHVAFRSFGATRMVLMVQETVVALRRAVEYEEYEVAVTIARRLLLECSSIRSVATAGELTWTTDEVSHDPFRGLTDAEVDEVHNLLAGGLELAGREAAEAWRDRVIGYVEETESRLGYGEPLPEILSPQGLYPALGVARKINQVVDEFRLPPLPFPDSWTRRD